MKRSILLFSFLLLATQLLVGVVSTAPAAAAGNHYICPPCGQPCDTTSFAAPGRCPACGMKLVEKASAAAAAAEPAPRKVAVLVFPGVEIIDFSGPYEMFGAAGCDVYTVAATRKAVTTAMGLTVVPKYTFADAPQPDVLVIPGGGVKAAAHDEGTLRYIRTATAGATHTMSVCNGAFILAQTGLLDGLSATTTNGNLRLLASQFPKLHVVRDKRYVDNGKLITTAGLTAGLDGALHVIARLFGTGVAQSVALGEEYNWQPDATFTRAQLADYELPSIDMDSMGDWTILRTEGDAARWDIELKGHSDLTLAALASRIEHELSQAKWQKQSTVAGDAAPGTTQWRFTGSDDKAWNASLKVAIAGADGHEYALGLVIAREGQLANRP